MSITIIGSNGQQALLITENKLNNKFNDLELEYNLLKDKYLTKCNSMIIDKSSYNHLLNQLSYIFVKSYNKCDLVDYINKRNNYQTFYDHTKLIVRDMDVLYHFHNILNEINKSLGISSQKNTIHNIKKIISILEKKDISDKEINISLIKDLLIKIKNETNNFKNNKQSSKGDSKIICPESKEISSDYMNNIIESLDNYIKINKDISTEIVNFVKYINELTDTFTKIYILI